jgi:enamine deaminase RidA (YjgF/YER057c/UK114 family)
MTELGSTRTDEEGGPMPHTVVVAEGAPPPSGPYAPAVLATGSRVLTISGQIAEGGGDAEEQARQCLQNLDALLRAAGAAREDVVRVGIFLTDMADRAAVARARVEYFGEHRPAATLVEVSSLVSPELKVEIEATAIF